MSSKRPARWGSACFIALLVALALTQMPFLSDTLSDTPTDTDAGAPLAYEHWMKLDHQGRPMAPGDGPWACVLDSQTGLVWENKSNDEGIHHGSWTYTWLDRGTSHRPALRQGPEGSCADLNHCNSDSLVQAANRQAWCGFSDWRVPELDELRGLLDHHYPPPGPLVCPCFLANTARSSYWTNTTNQRRERMGLNFMNGETRVFPEHASLYLRLVRGPSDTRPNQVLVSSP